jgi:hypothetical protein
MTGAQIPNTVGVSAMQARGLELMGNLGERKLIQDGGVSVGASYGSQRTSTATVNAAPIEIAPGFAVDISTTFTVPVLAQAPPTLDTGFGYVIFPRFH